MPVITVSQLNNYMKRYVEQNTHLKDLWIKGEISNFKPHYSGHYYFTVKDETSSLKCIVFKWFVDRVKFNLKDGMKVIIFGKISVYEQGGLYQLYGEEIIPDGAGELYAAYEQLKNRLENEGYFSLDKKKKILNFPQKIGVVTSVSGAALKDILNVFKRRYPIAKIVVYPAKVQGIGASESICDGIKFFSESGDCDVVIIARGGGSIEDLWAFNEEATAKAIYNCKTPIISGVGHETDYTISDFVADLRAPTPSAAAELAVPSMEEIVNMVSQYLSRSAYLLKSKINTCELLLKKYSFESIKTNLNSRLEVYLQKTKFLKTEMTSAYEKIVDTKQAELANFVAKLESLNPLSVLLRGYSVVMNQDGSLFNVKNANINDLITIVASEGEAECVVRRITHEKKRTTDI